MPTVCKTLGHQTGSALTELQSSRGERDKYGRCAGRYTWIKISHSHPLYPTPFSATWHRKVMTEKHGFTSCFESPYPLYLFLIQLCGVNIIISTWYRNSKTGDKTGMNIYWAPQTEEPGGLQSMGSRRVRHYWATSLSLFTFTHWRREWQPTPVFLPGESQGRGSLEGCRLWGHTELDTTEAT